MQSADCGVPFSDSEVRRWRVSINRELLQWRTGEACPECGEWIGHFGGSAERDPCSYIPLNVPLEEVRPNCLTVRRHWRCDVIRAACAN